MVESYDPCYNLEFYVFPLLISCKISILTTLVYTMLYGNGYGYQTQEVWYGDMTFVKRSRYGYGTIRRIVKNYTYLIKNTKTS